MKKETIDKIIEKLRLFDDDFMTVFFDNNIEDTQLVLRILMDIPDLEVTQVIVQRELRNLKGRSICMDIWARDSEDTQYDIEVQRADKGAEPKRARYNSSLLDGAAIKKKAGFQELPETYIIFITENDVLGKGCSLYHIERIITETGEAFNDKEHILYVNGATQEDSDVGRLMHDFRQSNPDEMYYEQLADTARNHKQGGGRPNMCKLLEDTIVEERKEASKEARKETIAETLGRFLKKMTPKEIMELGFSAEDIALAQDYGKNQNN